MLEWGPWGLRYHRASVSAFGVTANGRRAPSGHGDGVAAQIPECVANGRAIPAVAVSQTEIVGAIDADSAGIERPADSGRRCFGSHPNRPKQWLC